MGQEKAFTVEGTISEVNSGKAIQQGFVELFKASDSTMVSFQNTDTNGRYLIRSVAEGTYFMRVSHPEYAVLTKAPFLIDSDLNALDFNLETTSYELDAVVLNTRNPVAEMEGDKLKVYVSRIPGIEGNNSFELLGKLPGVWTEGDSSIKLNGSANVTILINGQRQGFRNSQDIALLQSISAENIERVEIISGGSAKYDATGGSIINVITKNKKYDGIYIGLSNDLIINKEVSNSHDLFLNATKGNFNASFSVGYGVNNNYYDETGTAVYRKDAPNETEQQYTLDYDAHKRTLNFYGNLNYDIDLKNKVALIFSSNSNHNDATIQQNSTYSGASEFGLNYTNDKKIKDNLTNASFIYEHAIDTTGTRFKTKIGYLDGFINEQQNFNNEYLFTAPPVDSIAAGSADIPLEGSQYIGKIDFEMPIDPFKIELGTKYTDSEIDNFVTYYNKFPSGIELDRSRSDSLSYKERVFAAYALVRVKFNSFSAQAGARLEQTQNSSSYISTQTVAENDYTNILPNVALSYKGKNFSSTLKFTSGITRPDYIYLNPYRYYINEFEYREGNPNLEPLKRNTLSLETNISDFLSISMGYHRYNDQIFVVKRQLDNGLQTLSRPENAASLNDYFANVSVYFSLLNNTWNGQLSLYGETYNYDIDPAFITDEEDLDNFTYFTFRFDNSYKLLKNLKINNRFSYRSNSNFYQIYQQNRWRLDLGVTLSLLDNKLKITAGVDDILDSYNYENRTFYDQYEKNYVRDLPLQRFRVSLSYDLNLGWKKATNNLNDDDTEETGRFKN